MADRDALEARLLIDGARVPAASGATVPVDYPATGTVLAYVAQAGVEDAHAAIEPARRSYEEGSWRRGRCGRTRVLLRLAELIGHAVRQRGRSN